MIKGIGPVYAKKMVQKFGDEVFDIIEHASARLETIEGIGQAPEIDQGCLAGTEGHSGYYGLFALQWSEHQPSRADLQDLWRGIH